MKIILGAILVAVGLGYALGGYLDNILTARIRWGILAFLGLFLQVLPVPLAGVDLPLILLFVSFAILLAFTLRNIRVAGFALILVGLSLNLLVIAVNHGMPVPRHALVASGQQDTLQMLIQTGGAKHHLAGAGDHLLFLADVLTIGAPIRQALSVGDVLSYLGVMWLIVAAMRGRMTLAATYVGRHRRRFGNARLVPIPSGWTTS
jgi:Family of unknown function (DUF5317)